MRRIYLTESQLETILGEDFTSYLPNESDSSEDPENSTGYEVAISDKDANGELSDTPTLDKIAKERFPMNYFRLGAGTYTNGAHALEEGELNETNQDLVQKQFRLSNKNKQNVQSLNQKTNGNDRLVNNMANETSFNIKTLYKRRYDLKKMRSENPERFAQINGAKLLMDIENQLDIAKKTSANTKKTKSNMGMNNVYQKAGGTKSVGNGQAHSKKNPNITYYN